jgi:hypothetical protein
MLVEGVACFVAGVVAYMVGITVWMGTTGRSILRDSDVIDLANCKKSLVDVLRPAKRPK